MPSSAGLSRSMPSSSFATGNAGWSAESTTKLAEVSKTGRCVGWKACVHYSSGATTVAFPHISEADLATQVPAGRMREWTDVFATGENADHFNVT